ncbi:CHASE2 domain-containing protein [bacterium]|nr:CHASE2 domain-containing protein [bacterium]
MLQFNSFCYTCKNKPAEGLGGFVHQKMRVWIKKFEKPLTALVGSALLSIALLHLNFNFLEANLYDLRMSHGSQATPDERIALITLDDLTTQELNDFSPLPLNIHAEFLEKLEKLRPRAVGYLLDLNHVNQITPDSMRSTASQSLSKTVLRMRSQGVPFVLGTSFDVTGEVIPSFPLNSLPHGVAVIHKDGNVFAEDKITRRALLTLYNKPSFHLYLARELGYFTDQSLPQGSYYIPEVDAHYFFFRYHGNTDLHQLQGNQANYKRYSYSDILKGRISSNELNGKIVLVGPLSKDDSSHFAFTPYSHLSFSNPKILVHANILDSIIHNNGISRTHPITNGLVTFISTTTVLWWIINSTPLYGVFATLTLAFVLIVISQILFQTQGFWIRESQPLVGIFVSYYLAVPYRLIREYKKRWDYQRKHEILTQVEEMKTHFLSLVTHDLKTPVARIQGLAEVILRKSSSQLGEKETQSLKNILSSTDELNHFITSILELSKVESNHLQLHFESKDLNQLIENSIQRFESFAKTKNIKLIQCLEPLFPIKIDVNLIEKVINNLIDNALKYSKNESAVTIKTQESHDWIMITIEDQGIGMSNQEIEGLFTRFYRIKNDDTSTISGTGLGLYLSKYFVEAHQGRITVESTPGMGSTFVIYLPIHTTLPQKVLQTEKNLRQTTSKHHSLPKERTYV